MLEIEAALEREERFDVGERSALRITVCDPQDEREQPTIVRVRVPATLAAISISPHLRKHSECELEFALPPLLRGERGGIEMDVYAREPGTLPIAIACENGGDRCDCEIAARIEARPAFAANANRFELLTDEGDAGTLVEGRAILTNTGYAPARIDAVRVASTLEELRIDDPPSILAPQERRIVRVTGRIPAHLDDGAPVRAVATALVAGCELALGETAIVARSRPRLEASLEDRADGRHVLVANAGGAVAQRALIELEAGPGVPFARCTIEQLAPHSGFELVFGIANSQTGEAYGRVSWEGGAIPLGAGTPRVPQDPGFRRTGLDPLLVRFLLGPALNGLMRHLWAAAVLCAEVGPDPERTQALGVMRVALRSVFDRLSIKLRMPHYPVTADDVLDAAATDAICAFAPDARPGDARGSLLAAAATAIVAADAVASRAAGSYRDALAAALRACDDAALVDRLVAAQPALDRDLETLLAFEREPVPC